MPLLNFSWGWGLENMRTPHKKSSSASVWQKEIMSAAWHNEFTDVKAIYKHFVWHLSQRLERSKMNVFDNQAKFASLIVCKLFSDEA